MALRNRPYLLFLAAAFAAFGVGHIIFGVIARVWIGQEDVAQAAREVLYSLGAGLLPFKSIPILVVAFLAGLLFGKKRYAKEI